MCTPAKRAYSPSERQARHCPQHHHRLTHPCGIATITRYWSLVWWCARAGLPFPLCMPPHDTHPYAEGDDSAGDVAVAAIGWSEDDAFRIAAKHASDAPSKCTEAMSTRRVALLTHAALAFKALVDNDAAHCFCSRAGAFSLQNPSRAPTPTPAPTPSDFVRCSELCRRIIDECAAFAEDCHAALSEARPLAHSPPELLKRDVKERVSAAVACGDVLASVLLLLLRRLSITGAGAICASDPEMLGKQNAGTPAKVISQAMLDDVSHRPLYATLLRAAVDTGGLSIVPEEQEVLSAFDRAFADALQWAESASLGADTKGGPVWRACSISLEPNDGSPHAVSLAGRAVFGSLLSKPCAGAEVGASGAE